MKAVGVSVVICCHNSERRISETLRHLQLQESIDDIPWEVVLVDNASTDATQEIARTVWNRHPITELRILEETRLGLQHARLTGIQNAKHDIVSFVDDDNWVASDWIVTVNGLFEEYQSVGAAGGLITATFESQPPDWFHENEAYFAVGAQANERGLLTGPREYLCGAGLSVRRDIVLNLLRSGFKFQLVDRKGRSLSSSGDVELCLAIRLHGWQLWYEPDMRLSHYMPASRLTWQYLCRLSRSVGQSYALLIPYFANLEDDRRSPFSIWFRELGLAAYRLSRKLGKRHLGKSSRREGNTNDLEVERLKGLLIGLTIQYKKLTHSSRTLGSAAWNSVGGDHQ